MAEVYNLKYSSTKDKMRDMFIAFKWLAELNGALCNSDEHYPKELKHYIELAGMCFKSLLDLEEIKDDDHLRYLKYKRDAKVINFKTLLIQIKMLIPISCYLEYCIII